MITLTIHWIHSAVTCRRGLHPNALKSVEASIMYPYLKTRRQQTMSTVLWWGSIAVALAMLIMLTAC